MPQIRARADVFRDWDAVLGAYTQNAALLPGSDSLKAELDAFMAQAKDLKIQQETLEGQRNGVTQKLLKVIEDGRESVRKLRALAVVHLGSDNKALSQFGVKPRVRRGPRKSTTPETPPPGTGTAAAPAPHPTESTQGKEGTHA